jgi:hypothetical protein
MGEKRRRHFPNHAPKKVVKQVKVVSGRKNLVATHTGFATFTAFFPGVLKNCQLLATLTSVDGAENVTRFIMVQRIVSQPMIMLSTGVGELTLLTKTQMTIGIETDGDTQSIRRHLSVIAIFTADIEAFVRSW